MATLTATNEEVRRDAMSSYKPKRKWTPGRIAGRVLFWALIVFLFAQRAFIASVAAAGIRG